MICEQHKRINCTKCSVDVVIVKEQPKVAPKKK